MSNKASGRCAQCLPGKKGSTIKKFYKISVAIFAILLAFGLKGSSNVLAATSPTLAGLAGYSVLGGAAVTCVGSTTTTGTVGVSPGTSISGFPSPCTAGGGTHSNDASAIAAQADNLAAFGTLDQACDQSFGAVDLTTTFPGGVGPGTYCSTSGFTLSGNLNLTGSGVWIFKTVSSLITSPDSSVTGGDPCNVWWRIGSSATLDTTTSFIGNILTLNGVNAMKTGATLNGRLLTQSAGTVTLDSNTVTGPTCAAASSGGSSSGGSVLGASTSAVPGLPNAGFGPNRNTSAWNVAVPAGIALSLSLLYLVRKQRAN